MQNYSEVSMCKVQMLILRSFDLNSEYATSIKTFKNKIAGKLLLSRYAGAREQGDEEFFK